MADDNRLLSAFVEGMVMGMLDFQRVKNLQGGWALELTNDPKGIHALYFVSPTGIRWRIRAEIEEIGGSDQFPSDEEIDEAMDEEMDEATSFEISSLQRGRVATWLKLKATGNVQGDLAPYLRACGGDEKVMQSLFNQLQMDALHSSLLHRLFNDEEPYSDTIPLQ